LRVSAWRKFVVKPRDVKEEVSEFTPDREASKSMGENQSEVVLAPEAPGRPSAPLTPGVPGSPWIFQVTLLSLLDLQFPFTSILMTPLFLLTQAVRVSAWLELIPIMVESKKVVITNFARNLARLRAINYSLR
jgi:hypothetical protein